MNYIASFQSRKIRIVGLSTALANANDLADWLGIGHVGLYNFRHSVRPVPLEIYIEGHHGRHYCPRMISMNKPTYSAIITHSPTQPVIVFVSSRRQTRLTARDLISFCAGDDAPRRFLHMDDQVMDQLMAGVKDPALRDSLPFGIGLHHAGLVESDRKLVEELFVNEKIQVLIATSTLAWGVNFPAHLVVVKGTEFFDAKIGGYVDFPITDVLQMMGRAGRPQFDTSGVAVVLVQDTKKDFYKKFLHEPFPVESSLHLHLPDHLNAEIAGNVIKTKQDALDFITWTYLFRRIQRNPTIYGCDTTSDESVAAYTVDLVDKALSDLQECNCLVIDELQLTCTPFGKIASRYYLLHRTMKVFGQRIVRSYKSIKLSKEGSLLDGDFVDILRIVCDATEYDEYPVRHNEDLLNQELEAMLPFPANRAEKSTFSHLEQLDYDNPHLKAFLLYEAHLSRYTDFSCTDYQTDKLSVLDQAIRILQAMLDVAVFRGFYATALAIISALQCTKQGMWPHESSLLILPHIRKSDLPALTKSQPSIRQLLDIAGLQKGAVRQAFTKVARLSNKELSNICNIVDQIPFLTIDYLIEGLKSKEGRWYLEPSKEYVVKVQISSKNSKVYPAYTPHFHKRQNVSWMVVIGNKQSDELWVLKRWSPNENRRGVDNVTLKFKAPKSLGQFDFDIDVLCDAYLGLDITLPFKLAVF